ncbi:MULTISPECIES: hypothetical protein [unclassified Microcella]|uniref:hypothetical protein n=1 Tax=unclassified Microcella TaxID=2630066 RepID=UPI0006F9CDAE|nr:MULTISPECIES: hypothetical protein [unclassified Microcella]KQV25895.1 hypothetical protein ASC54_02690 [Yonghaparkia sp. Root332]KRF33296.1 hypothetical protein ASG83_04940 [Yonghaparkia sp. Soil809]
MASAASPEPRAIARAVLLRAAPLLIAGLVITFTADHSPRLGLLALGLLGAALGAAVGLPALGLPRDEPLRGLHAMLAGLALVTGALALLRLDAGLPFLLVIAGGWAVLSGAVELVWGIRHRTHHPFARDAIVVGGATLVLAVVLAIVADSISAVGFLGAYAILVGVFLVIAALSLTRGASQKEHSPS